MKIRDSQVEQMLSSRNKKSIEKLHFEYFVERCKELPSCIHTENDDNPDFLCNKESINGGNKTQIKNANSSFHLCNSISGSSNILHDQSLYQGYRDKENRN